MHRFDRMLALALLATLGACAWRETAGDFTYRCEGSVHPLDGPHCEHRLTDDYLLRYGEGSGDHIVLAYEIDPHGSAALFNAASEDSVAQLGLDDAIIAARLRSGRIFVAPARPVRPFDVVGPLTAEEFATRYPSAPPWQRVQ